METKVLLRLIRDDVKLLDEITSSFISDSDLNSEEVDVALIRAKGIVTEFEMLAKNLAAKPKEAFKPNVGISEKKVVNVAPDPLSMPQEADLIDLEEEPVENMAVQNSSLKKEIEEKPVEKREVIVEEEKVVETIVVEEKPQNTVKQEVDLTKEDKKPSEPSKKTLGETIVEAHKLVNDLLSSDKGDQFYEGNPLKSIRDGIGLNDRFLFVRELFAGESTHYNEAIDKLDSFSSINEAVEFLKQNYKWSKSEASEKFLHLVKRRYTR